MRLHGGWLQAFVKCKSYYGVQFVKSLHILKDKFKQKAEVVHASLFCSNSYCPG